MIPSVDLSHSQKQMSQAMHCATSPKCWQRSMSKTLKSMYSTLYGYQWLNDIKVEPRLNHEPLLGKCLAQVLNDIDDPKEQSSNPSFQRKPAPPATVASKAKIGRFPIAANTLEKKGSDFTTTNDRTKSARTSQTLYQTPSQTSESKASHQLKQVMLQHKTAKVTSLHDWMQKGEISEQIMNPTLPSKPTHNTQKNNSKLVKKRMAGTSKALAVQTCNYSKWQQRIDRNIQSMINQVQPSNASSINRQKQQVKPISATQNEVKVSPLWRQKVATDKHGVQAPLVTLQYLFAKNEPQQKLIKNTHKKATNSVERSEVLRGSLNKQSLSPVGTEPLNKLDFVDHKVEPKSQRSSTSQETEAPPQQTMQPPLSFPTGDKQPTTQVLAEVEKAKPEFPPIRKMINEQLQVSGKRTALMRESQWFTPHEHDLDDEKLAEALKRIIDQQARRHGINV